MKPLPIFTVDADRYVRHTGIGVFQFHWFEAWPELESHWWCERVWWAR